jgi:DNA-binding PadR family transcriptional regulator
MKLLEETAKMYGYEITQKVKALQPVNSILQKVLLYPALHKLEAEGT